MDHLALRHRRQGRPATTCERLLPFRTITIDELHLAGRLAGMRIIARFGDYEFTPYHDGAERLIVLFQREDDDVQWIYEEAEEYDAAGDGDGGA